MSYLAKIGVEKERRLKVTTNQTTSFLWEGENVLSTPSMISEMEETCRLLVKEECILDHEWDSVGTLVNVRHLAATPVGAEIILKAKIVSFEGRRVLFEVVASDSLERIGVGEHERSLIEVPRFRKKFIEKQIKLGLMDHPYSTDS
jgi:fluoroacetyl-CoA thioesterase